VQLPDANHAACLVAVGEEPRAFSLRRQALRCPQRCVCEAEAVCGYYILLGNGIRGGRGRGRGWGWGGVPIRRGNDSSRC
jgi:hypothetical protein